MHNTNLRLALPALLLAAASLPASAMQIELGLNLRFNDTTDPNSGGEWQVIGRSLNPGGDNFGIHSIAFALEGISSGINIDAPSGTVNGVDDAGFSSVFAANIGSAVSIIVSHDPLAPTGPEVGEFYGFGSIENGSPNLGVDTPAGANTVPGSPIINTFSGDFGTLPWATGDTFGDPAFDVYAQIASGTFDPGQTPEFLVTPTNTFGQIFTSLGLATTRGDTSDQSTTDILFVETRTDLARGDFNGDTLIDAADYTIFRDTVGATVPLGTGADADGSGIIDLLDYEEWVNQFGQGASGAALVAAAVATPEPSSVWLLSIGLGLFANRSRRARG